MERTRQEVKTLDDLFKNMIVLVDGHYVKKPDDFSCRHCGQGPVRRDEERPVVRCGLLGLTDVIGDQDDVPRDAFEQTATKKLLASDASYEELVETGGKRYLRVATGVPVVSENCVMCHENFKGTMGTSGRYLTTCP